MKVGVCNRCKHKALLDCRVCFKYRVEVLHQDNMEKLELARMEQFREATDLNLLAQHRLLIANLLVAIVGFLSVLVAVAAIIIVL